MSPKLFLDFRVIEDTIRTSQSPRLVPIYGTARERSNPDGLETDLSGRLVCDHTFSKAADGFR